ncbi:MAG: radical SAM family heme chaperone HemW [Chitinophagales bacterium]|nr:radical SAM family heme chaperone HemW [Chitinophagales bacterium]
MAGIYIHVPFCKQACNYCNFYFSTSSYFLKDYLDAILQEISLQVDYVKEEKIESIYFGGGTPSILSSQSILKILDAIIQNYDVNSSVEITLEGNPDDLSSDKLKDLKSIGVNRLSIGTQSFQEIDLVFMKRAHNVDQAINSIEKAQQFGFQNLSLDLIYGVPTQTEKSWLANLSMVNKLGVNHLSSYALTVEEGTPLYHQIRKGKVGNVDDNLASEHFKLLQNWSDKENWQHYEISNLCRDGNYSRHNTSYWKGRTYLGLGPAAHSFNGSSRQWNVSNLKIYIEGISKGIETYTKEELSRKDQFNEFLMTGMRTQWGISKATLIEQFPEFYSNFEKHLKQVNPAWIDNSPENLILSNEGRFYADGIASSLFIES